MSRTYRRKKNRKGRNCESGFWYRKGNTLLNEWWLEYRYNGNVAKAMADFHGDNHSGEYSPPSWFFSEYCHKPERRESRDLIRKVLRLVDYEDTPLFPHHKKPKEYYW
mgnify:CR=1 FL=1